MLLQLTPRSSFATLAAQLRDALLEAPLVEVGEWHSQRSTGATTAELEDVSFSLALPRDEETLASLVQPNRAWADEHFAERVSGIPYNPPPSHVRWPYAQRENELHRDGELFSHTYPERLWPRPDPENSGADREGIRYRYGDLHDVVQLLASRRATRQAYIPIWFPEDGAAAIGGWRVPCTLGYHAMIRDGLLTLRYFMRSCDFIRHFRDDVYLAGRLAQWLCDRVNNLVNGLPSITPTYEPPATRLSHLAPRALVMHISSLHVFAPSDLQVLTYNKLRGRVW